MQNRNHLHWLEDARRPDIKDAIALAEVPFGHDLVARAKALRDEGHPAIISYSRKVFVPLTKLCRDVCHYCTFAQTPKSKQNAFLRLD